MNLPVMRETWVQSLGQEDSLEREWLPTPLFLPGEFHGQRSLVGHSPWGQKESDAPERLSLGCVSGYTSPHTPSNIQQSRRGPRITGEDASCHR